MRIKPNAQPNQSLIDGIATLQALATSPTAVGNIELSRRLGFEPSRVNRLLKTLTYLGIARQTSNRKYTSGPGMHVLAAQSLFASGFINKALPVLEDLKRFGQTVAMGVLWHDSVSYLFHAPPGTDSSRALGRIGILPASTSGIGMALLAKHEDEHIAEIYDGKSIPGFPDGIKALLKSVDIVRQNEYAYVVVGENRDRHTLAVPVSEPSFAAIGLSGWIPETGIPVLVDALHVAAEKIDK